MRSARTSLMPALSALLALLLLVTSNATPALAATHAAPLHSTSAAYAPTPGAPSSQAYPPLGESRFTSKSMSGSGVFLQRDPNGYEDSVNLYAGFGHDPVNFRDPTGRFLLPVVAVAVVGLYGYIAYDDDLSASVGAKLTSPGYWAGLGFGAAQAIIPTAGFAHSPYEAGSMEEAGRREGTWSVGLASLLVSLPNLIGEATKPPPQLSPALATGSVPVQAIAVPEVNLAQAGIGANAVLAQTTGPGEGSTAVIRRRPGEAEVRITPPAQPPVKRATGTGGKLHHIATNKNEVSAVSGGPWTPVFADIFRKAGRTLDHPSNLVEVLSHGGPHSEPYHRLVFQRLMQVTEGLSGSAYVTALDAELEALAVEAQTPGSPVNSLLTR